MNFYLLWSLDVIADAIGLMLRKNITYPQYISSTRHETSRIYLPWRNPLISSPFHLKTRQQSTLAHHWAHETCAVTTKTAALQYLSSMRLVTYHIQLERLRSEIPPAASWLSILVIHIRSQVKRIQSQSYKFLKKLSMIQLFKFWKKLYTRHTFWRCLIRCINMKWIQPKLYALQSGHGMRDGWTDERTEWNQYTPPTTSLCGGYNNLLWCNPPGSSFHWHSTEPKGLMLC